MSKKFTEEQFNKLVEVQKKYFPITMFEQGAGGKSPYDAIHESSIKLSDFIWAERLGNEAVAIMNPVTREWAHEQFVEKKKKYVWHLKEQYKHTDRVRLFKDPSDNSVSIYWTDQDNEVSEQEELTESEIKAWGYNPEMFDKEEVD